MSKSGGSSLKFNQNILGLFSAILGPSQIYTSSPQTVHMLFFMFETLSIITFLKLWRVMIFKSDLTDTKMPLVKGKNNNKKNYSMEACKDSELSNTNWMLE